MYYPVAPLVGACIETGARWNVSGCVLSRPSWARVLKLAEALVCLLRLRRAPRGRVY